MNFDVNQLWAFSFYYVSLNYCMWLPETQSFKYFFW